MSTETFLKREGAGTETYIPPFPAKSKHDLDWYYRNKHELALNKKELRLYYNEMDLYQKELANTVSDPKKQVLKCLNSWWYNDIPQNEANHVPLAA